MKNHVCSVCGRILDGYGDSFSIMFGEEKDVVTCVDCDSCFKDHSRKG